MATKTLYIQYDERLPYCKPREAFTAFLLTLLCARHYKNRLVQCLRNSFLPDESDRSVIMQAQKNAVSSNSFF